MGDIQRRDLFFFPGYDIEGVKRYHRYLQRQAVLYRRRFKIGVTVSALKQGDTQYWPCVDVIADWPEGRVHTRYHICDWTADVVQDYAPPAHVRFYRMVRGLTRIAARGQLWRISRKAPIVGTMMMEPLLLFLARIGVCLAGVWLATFGILFAVPAAFVAAVALIALRRLGGKGYETFYEGHIAYLDRSLTDGTVPEGDQLRDALTELETIDTTGADEIMIAGHSFGGVPATLAAEIISRSGDAVSLLTVGSSAAIIALDPDEAHLRPAITALYERDGICWRDYFAPQDALCFPRVRPLRDYGISPKRPHKGDVSIRTAVFGNVYNARIIRKFRWNFLRMHFQFIMAADVQGGYDWIRFTLGPDRLKDAAP